MEYRYPLMFEESPVQVLSYPLEAALAEKLETVVTRGIADTRGRNYYDITAFLWPMPRALPWMTGTASSTTARQGRFVMAWTLQTQELRSSSPERMSGRSPESTNYLLKLFRYGGHVGRKPDLFRQFFAQQAQTLYTNRRSR